MGGVAASGGYYISLSANKIVAEPGTITGSIGVLTGKVSFGKTLGLIGVNAETVSVGKNTLMDSPLQPFTDEQWANLNHQADVIYDDFTQKVADGRKLPLDKVRDVARGRVWSGADAKTRGLVDGLGGFWTAAGAGGGPGVGSGGRHDLPDLSPAHRPAGHGWGPCRAALDASLGLLGRIELLLNLPAAPGGAGPGCRPAPGRRPAARSSSRRQICRGRDAEVTGLARKLLVPAKLLNYNFRCAGARSWLGGTIIAIMVRRAVSGRSETSRQLESVISPHPPKAQPGHRRV